MAQAQDEGFHEIQLNGKQLVFLFMAATVVSVVIFLCGVLVGRGVRNERGAVADVTPLSSVAETTPPETAVAPAPTPAGSDPTAAAPPPAVDELSYFNRLEKPQSAADQLKPVPDAAASAEKAAPVQTPAPVARNAPPAANSTAPPAGKPAPQGAAPTANARAAAPPPAPTAPAAQQPPAVPADEPSGRGFAVQIAALNVRSEAEAIAKRLASKGYAAYVLSPADGTPTVYRVRVGKFPTRREAETVASKLQKEEQFKPWVTR